jgi:hypothetical protein
MKNFTKKNCSFYTDKPFTVFEIDDFLPEEQFKSLVNSFPDKKLFNGTEDQTSNRQLTSKDQNFSVFINKNNEWEKFIDQLNDKKIIDSVYYFSLIPNLKSRGLSFLKKWIKDDENKSKFFFYRKINWLCHFAIQTCKETIYPHTDSRTKLLSMIYYLSDDDKESNGTEFWKINKNINKWKNWNNKHLKSELELKNFSEDCEIFHKSDFKPNKLVGFIKNDISWHSVMDLTGNENSLRKTFNLFIRY